jgi:RimJ/RimL family protein N-acetyltransferase
MLVPTDLQLETSRCILRYPRTGDAARFLSAFQADDFPRYVPLGQITRIEQVRDWVADTQIRWSRGEGYTWTAERKSDHTPVGQVSLVRSGPDNRWSLAFWTHPDCWGQGFATEIARCAMEFAFDGLAASTLWAAAATRNRASLRVLRKLEMTYLGDNPEGYRIHEEPIPTSEFTIGMSDWTRSS